MNSLKSFNVTLNVTSAIILRLIAYVRTKKTNISILSLIAIALIIRLLKSSLYSLILNKIIFLNI